MSTDTEPRNDAIPVEGEQRSDIEELIESIRANPLPYVAAIVFVVACLGAGLFYRVYSESIAQENAAKLAAALELEDDSERAAALAVVASESSTVSAEALYLHAETAFRAGDLDTAAAAFEQLRSEFPDFQFTPDAVEGLGYIEESRENFEGAIALYTEVQSKWEGTYAARRQSYNIGRCYDGQNNLEAAIAAYQKQIADFPDSIVADRAQHELHQYRAAHPDMFESLDSIGLDQPDIVDISSSIAEDPEVISDAVSATEDSSVTEQ